MKIGCHEKISLIPGESLIYDATIIHVVIAAILTAIAREFAKSGFIFFVVRGAGIGAITINEGVITPLSFVRLNALVKGYPVTEDLPAFVLFDSARLSVCASCASGCGLRQIIAGSNFKKRRAEKLG